MRLNNNVYLISGKSGNACLYDLRNEFAEIYHMKREEADRIRDFLNGNDKRINDQLKDLINKGAIADSKDNRIEDNSYEQRIRFAWIEITKRCPYKCKHCYNESDKHLNLKSMSFTDFKNACDKLKRYGINRVTLIGGEPTIHPQFTDFLLYCSDLFDDIEVFTNGYVCSDEMIEIYKKNKIKIALSYYSDICDEYEKVTSCNGSFERINHTIELLQKHNIRYRLHCVQMKNIAHTDGFLDKLDGKPDYPKMCGSATFDLYDKSMLINKCIDINRFRQKYTSVEILRNIKGHNCFSEKIYVDCDLNVFPCSMERQLSHGNLKDAELEDVLRDDIMLLNKDHIQGCSDCEYRYVCFDCRSDRISENHLEKPWYCLYDEKKGVWKNVDTLAERRPMQ